MGHRHTKPRSRTRSSSNDVEHTHQSDHGIPPEEVDEEYILQKERELQQIKEALRLRREKQGAALQTSKQHVSDTSETTKEDASKENPLANGNHHSLPSFSSSSSSTSEDDAEVPAEPASLPDPAENEPATTAKESPGQVDVDATHGSSTRESHAEQEQSIPTVEPVREPEKDLDNVDSESSPEDEVDEQEEEKEKEEKEEETEDEEESEEEVEKETEEVEKEKESEE